MRERRTVMIGCLCVLLAACGGGSGSTGLITSEDAVIDDVRRTGTCGEFDGAPYCATDSPDATAPGGQSVSLVTAAPTAAPVATSTPAAPTPTPEATFAPTALPTAAPSPTPGSGSSATPGPESTPTSTIASAPTATPAAPTTTAAAATSSPIPTATPADERTVTASVTGFDAGAACATAARPAGAETPWQTAALVPVGGGDAPVTFPVPASVPDPIDLALLCFETPPATLPSELATLSDAEPTVVFVFPSSG